MAGRFTIRGDPAAEDSENSPDNSGGDSPRSADAKIASTSSSRRSSRRALLKRVVSVPLKDVEGYRLKGDPMSAPPSDSWAWRKYGQKPIKGSPYPRGYYRCSSSKGCPARKQVERSRDDPQMLVVTYSCEHNHPWPAARNSHNRGGGCGTTPATAPAGAVKMAVSSVSEEEEEETDQLEEELEEKKPVVVNNPSNDHQEKIADYKFKFIENNEFDWLSDFESTTKMLESPISAEDRIATDNEMAMIFAMRGEDDDESLFADLGELPECSTVFRRGMAAETPHQRPPSLATTI